MLLFLVLVAYQAEIEDIACGADLALLACFRRLLGLPLEPVVLDLASAGDLLFQRVGVGQHTTSDKAKRDET